MGNDGDDKVKILKRELFELEKTLDLERECLINLVNTLSVVVGRYPVLSPDVEYIKDLLDTTQDLPVDKIQEKVKELKNKILSEDIEAISDKAMGQIGEVKETLDEACRLVRKMIIAVCEDLYPLDKELESVASGLDINCKGEISKSVFQSTGKSFLRFTEELRKKIENDFRYINKTFLLLLEQIKGLEKTFAAEFGGEEYLKEIEYFEMRINDEVGHIESSFDLYTTINEIKTAVIEKIKNIKQVVSLRKKKEMERARAAKENMKKLQQRIAEAEKQAQELSRKAEELQTVAMKDGLTGLYNRQALELRLTNALKNFEETGDTFSLILVDVDRFKHINDTFGHVAGDKVLKKVGECLKKSFRENDFIARYGGDEFAVVIEKMGEDMASERVNTFKKNLSRIRFVSHKKGEINVKVSAGVAQISKGDTKESIIERADQAMYTDKYSKK